MNKQYSMNGSNSVRFMVIAASFVIVVAGMRAAQSILVPFLLSVFIAVITSPLLFWFHRRRVPMGISLLLVICIILGAGFLVLLLVGSSLTDFSDALPLYQSRLQEKTAAILTLMKRVGVDISDKWALEYVDPGAAMGVASKLLTGLGNVLSNAFLILLTVIFILLEAASFPSKLQSAFGASRTSMAYFENFITNINQYMAIKTWISLGTGILVTIWLLVLGVDYPFLWGVLAFLFNYVPNIGSIIAAFPAVLLALIQLGTVNALLTAVGYAVINVLVGSVIEPRFMGRGLGLSTLVVFLSLVFWGWILGPVGMLLSIPLTMALKIALSSSKETQWISILLGTGPLPQAGVKKTN